MHEVKVSQQQTRHIGVADMHYVWYRVGMQTTAGMVAVAATVEVGGNTTVVVGAGMDGPRIMAEVATPGVVVATDLEAFECRLPRLD